MATKKNAPNGLTDKRRTYPIDFLRARFWYAHVRERSKCKTNYALAKRFGGEQKKWANYDLGGQPNEVILTDVDYQLPGTMDLYTAGPDKLKLWPAIDSNDINTLVLISESSGFVDGHIAQFRLDVIHGDIEVPQVMGYRQRPDEFDFRLIQIFNKLADEIGVPFAKNATDLLEAWVQLYIAVAYAGQYEELLDSVTDSRVNHAYYEKMLKEERFLEIQLGTVKQKGRRIETEAALIKNPSKKVK